MNEVLLLLPTVFLSKVSFGQSHFFFSGKFFLVTASAITIIMYWRTEEVLNLGNTVDFESDLR
jgi:hypothetical protein